MSRQDNSVEKLTPIRPLQDEARSDPRYGPNGRVKPDLARKLVPEGIQVNPARLGKPVPTPISSGFKQLVIIEVCKEGLHGVFLQVLLSH